MICISRKQKKDSPKDVRIIHQNIQFATGASGNLSFRGFDGRLVGNIQCESLYPQILQVFENLNASSGGKNAEA